MVKTKPCAVCGTEFAYKLDRARYCSRKCTQRDRRATHPGESARLTRESVARQTPERVAELRTYRQIWYENNPERAQAYKERDARRRAQRRREVLDWYGGKCACCGEAQEEFLSMDHVNGGGAQHRREIRKSLPQWLWEQGGPVEGFRILCHNCNQSRGAYGYCPHERDKV